MSAHWLHGVEALERDGHETLVVIGNFDGVHRGHQALLQEAAARSQRESLRPLALTFAPHPAAALGRTAPPVLTPLARKVELLCQHVPEVQVLVQPFDAAFAALTPEQFADFLRQRLGARGVVVGHNFRFGQGRAGDRGKLLELGQERGFWVEALALRGDDHGPWSSTRVRQALARGDLADANGVLGRPHELEGVVVQGQQRARGLGFPTANLAEVEQAPPAYGVYAIRAERIEPDGSGRVLGGGVANIGVRPTVAAGFAIEAHIFDLSADLYGARVRLRLVAHLREERTFGGLDQLRAQISEDARAARAALAMETDR